MTDIPSWVVETVVRQQQMNQGTWSQLQERGVNDETSLRLDFWYEPTSPAAADQLVEFLRGSTDYDVTATPAPDPTSGELRSVTGQTQPTVVDLETLDGWVHWMTLTGWSNGGCRFDGWGTRIP